MEKMVVLLQDYIALLQETQAGSRPTGETNGHSYHIPADTLSEAEWEEFDNVYQIHCPKIFLDSAVRDVRSKYVSQFDVHMASSPDNDAIFLLFQSPQRSRVPHGDPVCKVVFKIQRI